jgi:hypothetical protein
MNVHDIIQSHLKEIGAEGLANGDEECGCDIDDLAPCGEACMECVPAHRCFIRGLSDPGYIAMGSSHLYVRASRQASNSIVGQRDAAPTLLGGGDDGGGR